MFKFILITAFIINNVVTVLTTGGSGCGQNEVTTTCIQSVCEYRSCSEIGGPIRCVRVDPKQCKKGCICKPDYLRDDNGICIPASECPNSQPPATEESSEDCYEIAACTGQNEIIGCYNTCPQTCESIGKKYNCPLQSEECEPVCRCKPNYFRNKKNECISRENCLKCTGPHEYFSCGSPCDNECSTLYQKNQTHCPRINKKCTERCYCEKGYARDTKGICIPIKKCPRNNYCGINEIYDDCPPICPEQSCDVDEKLILCQPNPQPGDSRCKPGYRCIDNYKRNSSGVCIPKEECPNYCGINEIYDVCPPSCPPQRCDVDESLIGRCLDGPKPGDPDCNPGCRCKDNYKRDASGVCIPKEECPPFPSITCGPDEEYNPCVNGGCGRWKCSQRGIICIDLFEGGCKEGCRCKEPLLRTDDGRCVPADQCPLQCYGQNEVAGCFTACPNTCDSIGVPCNLIEPAVCTPNCNCKPGFYRNKIGDCISEEQCLQCTGPNEYFSCGPECDNECATLATQNQTNCPIVNIVCNEKCYCEKDYARDKNGICVPIEQCSNDNNNCGINEIYDVCPKICPAQRCDVDERIIRCAKNPEPGDPDCKPGCRCVDNYKKDASGVCIPKEQCPPFPTVTCGPDEEYTPCVNGGCGRFECSQPGIICIDPIEGGCIEGCRCKEPLLRTDDGRCVPADECPLQCYGQNEVAGCFTLCPETCDSIGVPCDIIEPAVCTPNCRCKPGFYRNKIGDCISEDQCLQCSGPNEYFSCGSACDNECATLTTQNQTNCPIINIVCNNKCYCEEDYARNKNGICVPIEQCNANNYCGINEIYDECPPECPEQRCDVDEKLILCLPNPQPGDPNCNPGCRCIDGYKKNASGTCIPKEECPPITPVTCGPDEDYNGCANGGCGRWECSQQGIICIDLIEGGCIPGCRCKEPLLRADDGRCVPADQCPLQCYGQNEVAGCYTACPETCDSIGVPCNIIEPAVCTPNCRCKPGFYRNKIGDCISKDQCLQCTGPNEYFSCGPECDNECATLATQNQTNCPIVNIVCNEKCYCEKDYARNKNGICIPIEQCSNDNNCGINEIYDICPQICPAQRCDVDERIIRCAKNPEPGDPNCKPGCRCLDNYKKDASGVCIPKEQCPPFPTVTCGPDEEYTPCVNGGCGRFECSQPGIICIDPFDGGCREGCRCKEPLLRTDDGRCVPADECPLQCYGQNEVAGCLTLCPETCESIGVPCDIIEPAMCTPNCRCKPGYYRNKIGDCISEKQCLQCSGPNEFFSCGSACDNECATLATQNQTNCPIINIVCNNKCYCEEDYARDKNGICVPIEQCNANNYCGINEIYDDCPPQCPEQRCDVDEKLILCLPNPQPGDSNCNPGCRCIDGYKKNASGICIPKEECPPITPVTCGPDEDYNGCANGGCGRWECSQQGIICIDLIEGGCIPGCRCKEPLLRANDGRCVPADQCPLQCYGPNEVAGCYTACPETCDSIGKPCDIFEAAVCKPYCRCKPGFYRNKIGDCISKDQCLQCCGPNEYFSCGTACDNVCATLATQNQTNCPIDSDFCNEMCYCEENYARNENGICIPIEQCATNNCGINEVYDLCPPTCPPPRCDVDEKSVSCVRNPDLGDPRCKPGCRCLTDYKKNASGICIPKEECPPIPSIICAPDEEYSNCVNGGCGRFNCSQPGEMCIKLREGACVEGCRCKKPLLRSEDGTCVPAEQCSQNVNGIQKFTKGNDEFTKNFLFLISKDKVGQSIICSPFSLLILLAQLAYSITGTAQQQIFSVLNLESKNLIRSTIPTFAAELTGQNNITLDLAARVYGNYLYKFSKSFEDDTLNIFKAQAQNLDFSNPNESAKTINDWVALITRNLITNLVPPSALDSSTRLVLVNAIYFKGDWRYPFKIENTKKQNFFVNKDKTVEVDMMNQIRTFKYTEISNPNCQVLQLPYANSNFTFNIILPKEIDGIDDLINALRDPLFLLSAVNSNMSSPRVDASIPRFNLESTEDLNDILKKLKMTDIFDPETSGMSGLLETPQELFVSTVIQKAKIIVTETGTVAAAANAIIVGVTSVMLPTESIIFNANHPFVYLIQYKETPIFCGIYYGIQ